MLLGLGSTLTGVAAIITAKNAVQHAKGGDDELHSEDSDSSSIRVIDGGGERSSSSSRDSGSDISAN
jgi:hypothetical protein